MSTSTVSRTRKANWGDGEINTLVEECVDHIDIINGCQGEVSNFDKVVFWKESTERCVLNRIICLNFKIAYRYIIIYRCFHARTDALLNQFSLKSVYNFTYFQIRIIYAAV